LILLIQQYNHELIHLRSAVASVIPKILLPSLKCQYKTSRSLLGKCNIPRSFGTIQLQGKPQFRLHVFSVDCRLLSLSLR